MGTSLNNQDTVNTRIVVHISTDRLISDSVFRRMDEIPGYMKHADSGLTGKVYIPRKVTIDDTISVCSRNSIADVTFYDSLNFINDLKFIPAGRIAYNKNAVIADTSRQNIQTILINDLKEGDILPGKPFHNDFITIAVFFTAFVMVSVRSAFKKTIPEITRFFLFRGIGESVSRDISSLFSWQSTVINFISFLIFALFALSALTFYELIPSRISTFPLLSILFGIVVFGITSRHLIIVAAGNLSGQTEVFNEYLITVYQSYRFTSFVLYMLLILMTYTVFIPRNLCVTAGFTTLGIFYVFRVTRLFLIFIKRDISILYLILYLCALEFLPVSILVKYFTGLI